MQFAFNESGNLPFRKVNSGVLKVLKRICVEKIVAGIRFPPICAHYVQCITERLTDASCIFMCRIIFRYVYTGTRADKKRALEKEDMERLMKDLPKQLHSGNRELQRTRGFLY